MSNPLVSVLMTTYNAEPFIGQAIQSVFDQSYENWELLILDDASTDKTRAIIDSYTDQRIRRIYQVSNIGYVASKNILLNEFRGSYACFLDADDWMSKNRIAKQLEVFTVQPEVGACMCNYWRVQPDGLQTPMNFYTSSQFVDVRTDEINFAGAGIMFTKEVVDQVGGYEMYFDKLMGDDNYWAFKVAEKFKFYYLEQPLYFYRANPNSITATFNNLRKLSIVRLLTEIKNQRLQTGTDWLEQKQFAKALAFEHSLINNKRWLAERYREAAAVRLDYNDTKSAGRFLLRSLQYNPLDLKQLRTFAYFIRKSIVK